MWQEYLAVRVSSSLYQGITSEPVAILLPRLICLMYTQSFVIVKIVSWCFNGYILLVSLETTNWLKESVCVYACCCMDPGLGQE